MRAVVQRVSRASVSVDGRVVASIGAGLLVLLGVAHEDTERDGDWLARSSRWLLPGWSILVLPTLRLSGYGVRLL